MDRRVVEFPRAAAAYPREQFQRLASVALFALFPVTPRVGDDPVQAHAARTAFLRGHRRILSSLARRWKARKYRFQGKCNRIGPNRPVIIGFLPASSRRVAVEAEARGWPVYWYDRERVFRDAAAVLGCQDVKPLLDAMGRSIGAPWQAKHRLAATAALAAARHPAP